MSSSHRDSGGGTTPENLSARFQRDVVLQNTPVKETIRRSPSSHDVQYARLPTLQLAKTQPTMFDISDTRLGAGGVGDVLLATQPALRREVAVKVARREGGMPQPERMLLREALVMGYLEHPNIVPIHVLARDESGEVVVAMKRIEGETLESILEQGSHSFEQQLDILMAVCNALRFAHEHGIVHLDLKPANVMVGPYGDTYLLDWGGAVAFRDDVPETIPRPLDDGQIYGTPAYVAPEMVVCAPPHPHSDIFLAGGVLYELLTGDPPNPGEKAEDALEAAYRANERPFPHDAPDGLVEICKRALSRNPDLLGDKRTLRDTEHAGRSDRYC